MNPKDESQLLLNEVLPFAEQMLREHGEFYPYGGFMKLDGSIAHVGASDLDTDRPKSQDLIQILRNSFQDMAQANQCKAVALVFDVRVTIPDSGLKSDAIQVCLEHKDGYSAQVFFPYQINNDDVVYGDTFAQQGNREVF